MAESVISPAELFKGRLSAATNIPTLKRNPKDTFILFRTSTFASEIIGALHKVALRPGYRQFLIDLTTYVAGTLKSEILSQSFAAHKSEVHVEETIKYFGEVLGALYVARKYGATQLCYPVRSNYELFDYFLSDGKKGWKGYSAKALSGGSNTLAPKLIAERLESEPAKTRQDIGARILLLLANAPTFQGTVETVGLLANADIFPQTMSSDKTMQRQFKSMKWVEDAKKIEAQKTVPLRKLGVSQPLVYEAFLSKHVTPRMRNNPGPVEKWTATNLVYGLLAMYVADTSKEGRFNITPMISKLFPDLNIVKMGITSTGLPDFHLSNRGQSKDAVTLRSKARWDTIKDKLGVQL